MLFFQPDIESCVNVCGLLLREGNVTHSAVKHFKITHENSLYGALVHFSIKIDSFFFQNSSTCRFQRLHCTSYTYEDERGHSPCPRTAVQALRRSISPRPAFSEAVCDCILP